MYTSISPKFRSCNGIHLGISAAPPSRPLFAYINDYSITSAPSESQARDTIITLAVRNMGGQSWTNGVHRLLEETLLPDRIKVCTWGYPSVSYFLQHTRSTNINTPRSPSAQVRLDGPYGKMSIDLFKYHS